MQNRIWASNYHRYNSCFESSPIRSDFRGDLLGDGINSKWEWKQWYYWWLWEKSETKKPKSMGIKRRFRYHLWGTSDRRLPWELKCLPFLQKTIFLAEPDVFALHLREGVLLCYSGCRCARREEVFHIYSESKQHISISLWGVHWECSLEKTEG